MSADYSALPDALSAHGFGSRRSSGIRASFPGASEVSGARAPAINSGGPSADGLIGRTQSQILMS